MFRNDLWIAEPNSGQLYKTENGSSTLISDKLDKNISCVMVSQDMVSTYVASVSTNRVSHIRGGVLLNNTIEVGSIPTSMCEDGNGVIWVTNYGDNTVSKVVNDKVVKTISVPAGPRDVVADSRNNVYVVCYLANQMAHIVNDVVVETIDTFLAPRAVTCDIADNIWVIAYASGNLTKYTNSRQVLTLDLKDAFNNPSPGPVDIVTDSNANIYVASYYGEVVRIKSNVTGTFDYLTIPVPPNPTALAVDAEDTIWVTSESQGVVTPIRSGVAGTPIYICDNPIGFGDFTGCATYNIYHDNVSAGATPPWSISQMDTEIQQLLGKIKSGTVNTSADLVSYNSVTFPTVEDALNSLLNVTPIIEDFNLTTDTYEYGSVISSLQVNWAFNKPMTSAEIRMGSSVLADLATNPGDPIDQIGSKIITGFTIDSNLLTYNTVTLQLRAVDENSVVVTKTVNLYFGNKFLYGALSDSQIVTQYPTPAELDSLNRSPVFKTGDGYNNYFKIDCGLNGDKVPCVAFPTSWGVTVDQIAFLNGFVNDWIEVNNVTWTNGSGGSVTYKVFIYNLPLAGEMVGTFVKLL